MSTYKLADMNLFSRVDEGQVIISNRGVIRQVDLYTRGEQLFAALKDGFVRLLSREHTTVPSIRWIAIEGIHYVEGWNGPKQVEPEPEPVVVKTKRFKVAK